MFRAIIIVALLYTFSLNSFAEDSATAVTEKTVNCESPAGPRKLVIAAKEKGCELQYTKSDKMDVIATQKLGSQFCQEKLEKVKAKLEGSGYKCQ